MVTNYTTRRLQSKAYGVKLAEVETRPSLTLDIGFCQKGEVQTVFGFITEVPKMLKALRRELATKH